MGHLWGGPLVIVGPNGATYKLESVVRRDGVSITYASDDVQLKMALNPSVNDLLENEFNALMLLNKLNSNQIPQPLVAFQVDGVVINVLAKPDQDITSLVTIREHYPNGIDMRDAIWMWKRLMALIASLETVSIVHGAILPHNVHVSHIDHEIHVVNWAASAKVGERIKFRERQYTRYNPDMGPAGHALDIYMAAKTIQFVVDAIPEPMQPFFDRCISWREEERPRDASVCYSILDSLARRCYGPPRFRLFVP